MSALPEAPWSFGPFTLLRTQRLLMEDGQPVRIADRTFSVLTALLERAGEVVSKQDLMSYAWPESRVEEASLRVHVAAARAVLGEGKGGIRYIVNVPGRGYCFVATIAKGIYDDSWRPLPDSPYGAHNLPSVVRPIGRAELIAALVRDLERRRLVSIVGPAGMGKTTLALAAAAQLMSAQPDGVWFVDLSRLDEPGHVPAAIATALGLSSSPELPVPMLLANLRSKRLLFVIDGCEHLLDAAAVQVLDLLRAGPEVRVLATSREPLRVEGEWVQRVGPLDLPPRGGPLPAAEARRYAAVQLFVERAIASVDSFELTDANAEQVSEVCRRLDGMPLAIELAAARIQSHGIQGLVRALDDRFSVLSAGHRAAGLPRHRTLGALLDWSFGMLSEAERVVMRRLSVFRAEFSLAAAQAVVADERVSPGQVTECLASLVNRSLVMADAAREPVEYRFLETTREYAFAKFVAAVDELPTRRRHLLYLCERLRHFIAEGRMLPHGQWIAAYNWPIDDVRAAIQWSLSPGADLVLGARLTAIALSLSQQMSMFTEFSDYAVRMARVIDDMEPPELETQVALNVALLTIQGQMQGPVTGMRDALARAMKASDSLDPEGRVYRSMMLHAQWMVAFGEGDYAGATRAAESLAMEARASGDPATLLLAERMLAQALHFGGYHAQARALAQRVAGHPSKLTRPTAIHTLPPERRVSMRIVLCRIMFLEGSPEEALEMVEATLPLAREDIPYALCHVYSLAACPIAFWSGDLGRARQWAGEALDHASRLKLRYWQGWAERFLRAAEVLRDDADATGCADRVDLQIHPMDGKQLDAFASISPRFVGPAAARRLATLPRGWCAPEVLRAQARRATALPDGRETAHGLLRQAIALSREQGARAWELRALIDLAGLQTGNRRLDADAREDLLRVVDTYSRSARTSDLDRARRLLDATG